MIARVDENTIRVLYDITIFFVINVLREKLFSL